MKATAIFVCGIIVYCASGTHEQYIPTKHGEFGTNPVGLLGKKDAKSTAEVLNGGDVIKISSNSDGIFLDSRIKDEEKAHLGNVPSAITVNIGPYSSVVLFDYKSDAKSPNGYWKLGDEKPKNNLLKFVQSGTKENKETLNGDPTEVKKDIFLLA